MRSVSTLAHGNVNNAESENETLEVQDKRKQQNPVNEKTQDTTSTLKTLPTLKHESTVTIRLHVDIRAKSKIISMRKRYSSILITQIPVGIQQDYTSKS